MSSSSCFQMESLMCPCILLGNIETKLHRETPVIPLPYCPECQLGVNGWQSCASTCFLACFGWPMSPLLSCFLWRMRYKLHLLYENDDRFKWPNSWCRCLQLSCCWCTNLQEQYSFVNNLWEENQLTFHWDFDRFADHLDPRPTYPSKVVLIFCTQNFSTTTFMNKFLRHTSVAANVAATSGSSKRLHHFLTPEMLDLEHVEQVETGVKTHLDSNGNISFLEVWKIPPSKFHSQVLAKSIAPAVVSYYLFDLSDKEHIEDTKKAFTEHCGFSTGRRLAVALIDVPSSMEDTNDSGILEEGINYGDEMLDEEPVPQEEDDLESPELSPLVIPKLTIQKKALRELKNWARQHSILLYEVSL